MTSISIRSTLGPPHGSRALLMTPSTHTAKKSSLILLLMTMTLLGVFPLDVVLPSFPALSDYFQTSASDIALSVSLFAIGLALSVVLVGPLSDLWGRKTLLLTGIAISVVGATGCLLSSEYSGFLVFRVIQAVGCGSFVLSQALIQDLFVGKEQERIRIWMTTAAGVFISISPLLGTWLQMHLGWEGQLLCLYRVGSDCLDKGWRLAQGEPTQSECGARSFFQCLLAAVFRPALHGLLAYFRPGLRLPFFIHCHVTDHFHGTPGTLALRICLDIVAVRRGLCVRRDSRQCAASASAGQFADRDRPGAYRTVGVGHAVAGESVRAHCRCGADPHAHLHGRHHHCPAYRQLQSHDPLSTGCRYVLIGRRRHDLPLRRGDQCGDQSRVRRSHHGTRLVFPGPERGRPWFERADHAAQSGVERELINAGRHPAHATVAGSMLPGIPS
ncbi:membrane hypothetical protein [Pseudomonas sp. IT-P100]